MKASLDVERDIAKAQSFLQFPCADGSASCYSIPTCRAEMSKRPQLLTLIHMSMSLRKRGNEHHSRAKSRIGQTCVPQRHKSWHMLDLFQALQLKSSQWPKMDPSGISLLAISRMSLIKAKCADHLSSGTDSSALWVFMALLIFVPSLLVCMAYSASSDLSVTVETSIPSSFLTGYFPYPVAQEIKDGFQRPYFEQEKA